MAVQFGVAFLEGEDENGGVSWFNIGPVDDDGCVSEEFTTILDRSGNPERLAEKQRRAHLIAEALTDYAWKNKLNAHHFGLG